MELVMYFLFLVHQEPKTFFMKTFLTLLLSSALATSSLAQSDPNQLIDQGIEFHDKGEYDSALAKYDQVLKADPSNGRALYEKSYTLIQMKRYDDCEAICKQMLQSGKDYRKEIYVQYGNLLDVTNRQKESLELYDKGIKEFPDFNMLYFNKGITLSGMGRDDEAAVCFQQDAKLKPLHASAHYAIGKTIRNENHVPAFMSLFTFILMEPQSERSVEVLKLLNKLMTNGVTRKDSGNIVINMDASILDKKNKKVENDFSEVEFMLTLSSSLLESNDSPLKSKSDADRLSKYLDFMISSLDEHKKKAKGFYWSYYVPFFIEMKSKDFVEAASNIAYASANDDQVKQWLKDNSDKTTAFYVWLQNYSWSSK
jgi:hypothetical protein